MNYRIIIIFLILIAFLLSGCIEEELTGTYINQNNTAENVTLYADGNFHQIFHRENQNYEVSRVGTFEIQKNKLVLLGSFGSVEEFKIEKGGLRSEKGDLYEKAH